MIELSVLPSALQAVILVGIVLIEAVLLYVGYGKTQELVAPQVLKAIQNTK